MPGRHAHPLEEMEVVGRCYMLHACYMLHPRSRYMLHATWGQGVKFALGPRHAHKALAPPTCHPRPPPCVFHFCAHAHASYTRVRVPPRRVPLRLNSSSAHDKDSNLCISTPPKLLYACDSYAESGRTSDLLTKLSTTEVAEGWSSGCDFGLLP